MRQPTWTITTDIVVLFCGLACFYGVVLIARYWSGVAIPQAEIDRSPTALPLYSLYSFARILIAYVLSLAFALGYGWLAAHNKRLETPMLAILDVLQSIPVLSFLPGVMLALVALIPTRQLGLELGAVILIFTGQVWNMAFSFYSSLKSIPRELHEAAEIYRLSHIQRFFTLELPYGIIGLVWNSMVSVAGGWFFLMACEMFVLGNRDFRLPGLGSYLQTAASAGDTAAIVWGLVAMIGMIVVLDQLVWRPVIAWSDKFKFEQVESIAVPRSPILEVLRRSQAVNLLRKRVLRPMSERVSLALADRANCPRQEGTKSKFRNYTLIAGITVALAAITLYASWRAISMLREIDRGSLTLTLKSAMATFVRVNAALLFASAWTIPAGVAIGFHPRIARIAQPLAQIAASVPATALFPVLLLALADLGGGLGIGSVALMLLGTQWYILFNVIAGAMAIPSDLREVADVFKLSRGEQWRTVILPGIFPYLVTGLVTASGGAWNASIIAEYFHIKGETLSTIGLGAEISHATDTGNFPLLLLATIIMAVMVLTVNRLIWRPLYHLAETRFKLDI
ncbi:MAG TPA: ABC transporter permease subunit [Candidatus Sulfotelmatobacter sp.]|nr:ABC transporter permease subunit [Candidatus Sulfotelmatobacter sp.]